MPDFSFRLPPALEAALPLPPDQTAIFLILVGALAMFLWGRWRHDMVALGALLAAVATGLVAPADAFEGFGHPAVVTVACVLAMSRGLQTSGAVDWLAQRLLPPRLGPVTAVGVLTAFAALVSGVMNNVGALALLMPVALQMARKLEMPPGRMLMPLAFGSILGGMTTLIGTPPNLIVSAFREDEKGGGFAMFDFTPVGAAVAAAGVLFVVVAARWLVPNRQRADVEGFSTAAYFTEAKVGEDGKAVGLTLREVEDALAEADAQVVGLVRNEVRLRAPRRERRVRAGDILVLEAEPEALAAALSKLGLTLEEAVEPEGKEGEGGDGGRAEPSDLAEFAVLPGSHLAGRSAKGALLRTRYGVSLLAVSREGRQSVGRLRDVRLSEGDVLMMQGAPEALAAFAADFACAPLAERALRLPDAGKMLWAVGIMAAAVGAAAAGLAPAAVTFTAGLLAMMATRVTPPRSVYAAIDWPVVVLLGALIPVAGAMETTGAARLVAETLIAVIGDGRPLLALGVVMVTTMFLSDVVNNAATAAVMCPIALGAANALGASGDAFLMAVAIGASCAFLTPIGHQNNTLILGPGGFRFGDYWRLGLPLEIVVVAVGVPMIVWVWGL
ncbi:MAG: SLC13 family permease [Rhodobacteraceae bacterium]|nr:MAG: SLC13 family permease [Paracoccaceae bacterium]